MAGLRITNGPLLGRTIEIAGEVVLGRENADVLIEDPVASRRHAAVRLLAGAVEIEDLGSLNGTFVDGQRIEGPTRVGEGAQIRIGSTVVVVEGVPSVGAKRDRPGLDTEATKATPVADPQVTRVRPAVPDLQLTKVSPAGPDPQLTKARPAVEDPQVTEATRLTTDPQVARARPAVDPHPTPGLPQAAPRPAGPTAAPVNPFQPPAGGRGRGLASRSWIPVVLSFGSVIVTAVALVVYFATR